MNRRRRTTPHLQSVAMEDDGADAEAMEAALADVPTRAPVVVVEQPPALTRPVALAVQQFMPAPAVANPSRFHFPELGGSPAPVMLGTLASIGFGLYSLGRGRTTRGLISILGGVTMFVGWRATAARSMGVPLDLAFKRITWTLPALRNSLQSGANK